MISFDIGPGPYWVSLQRTRNVGENEKQKALSSKSEGRHSVYRGKQKDLADT